MPSGTWGSHPGRQSKPGDFPMCLILEAGKGGPRLACWCGNVGGLGLGKCECAWILGEWRGRGLGEHTSQELGPLVGRQSSRPAHWAWEDWAGKAMCSGAQGLWIAHRRRYGDV